LESWQNRQSIFLDADPLTVISIPVIITGLGAMGLGFFSRDNDVSSEEAGAKKED